MDQSTTGRFSASAKLRFENLGFKIQEAVDTPRNVPSRHGDSLSIRLQDLKGSMVSRLVKAPSSGKSDLSLVRGIWV